MCQLKLEIKLLSDMCCGSGEGSGVHQDICSSYDEHGLPVIYGKRLKGILRDRAEFLLDYGYPNVNSGLINRIFGTGEFAGIIRVGNAQLFNAKHIKTELEHMNPILKEMVTPMGVESVYTVDRFSTEISSEGVAENHSLRLIGAVPKGEVFYADIDLAADIGSEEYVLIEKACKLLRRIGLNRTRGFGEVDCTLSVMGKDESETEKNIHRTEYPKFTEFNEEDTIVEYILSLQAPVIFQTDYISGSAVQGIFINQLCKQKLITEDEVPGYLFGIRFSNAYLHENGRDYFPMPKGMRMVKNQSETIYSMADGYEMREDEQYVRPNGYCCCEGNQLFKTTPSDRIEYHYAKKTHDLFTIRSLRQGQKFRGRIEADDPVKLQNLIRSVNQSGGIVSIGASASAQYATAIISFVGALKQTGDKSNKNDALKQLEEKYVFNLLSDTVIIDDDGVNTVEVEILKKHVQSLFKKSEEVKLDKVYTDIVTVGGYHAKWKLPKRRYRAFAKGTQLVLRGKPGIENRKGFLGFLQSEGYGEYEVRTVSDFKEYKVLDLKKDTEKAEEIESIPITVNFASEIVVKVLWKKAEEECRIKAEKAARAYCEVNSGLSSSSAMRLLSAYKAVENKPSFKKELKHYIRKNFSGKSNEEIFKFSERSFKVFEEMNLSKFFDELFKKEAICQQEWDRKWKSEEDLLFRIFIQYYLNAAKLYYREQSRQEGRE